MKRFKPIVITHDSHMIKWFINKKRIYICRISQINTDYNDKGELVRIWLNSVAWGYHFFSVRLEGEAMYAYLEMNPELETPKEDIVLDGFFLRKSTTGTDKPLIILSKLEDLLNFYLKSEWDKLSPENGKK